MFKFQDGWPFIFSLEYAPTNMHTCMNMHTHTYGQKMQKHEQISEGAINFSPFTLYSSHMHACICTRTHTYAHTHACTHAKMFLLLILLTDTHAQKHVHVLSMVLYSSTCSCSLYPRKA